MGRQAKVKQSRKGSSKLPTLAVEKVESPWNEVLLYLAKPISQYYLKSEQAVAARNVGYHRRIITCWVMKLKWKPHGYKIPRTRVVQGYKPVGEMFYCMLQFSIECHSLMSESYGWWNSIYPNAWRWFQLVFDELLSAPESVSNLGTDDSADQHQAELNELRVYKNPYDRQENPHCFWLFQAAIQMGQRSTSFYKEYYSKYLKAKRAYIAAIRKGEWCTVRVDEHGP